MRHETTWRVLSGYIGYRMRFGVENSSVMATSAPEKAPLAWIVLLDVRLRPVFIVNACEVVDPLMR